jgi:hypothetical protein
MGMVQVVECEVQSSTSFTAKKKKKSHLWLAISSLRNIFIQQHLSST